EHIREIFKAYGWHEQIPSNEQAVKKEKLEAILEEMHATLIEAKDAWIKYNDGQKNNLSLLLTHIRKLKELAVQIKHQSLEKLITVIGGTAAHLNIQPQAMSEILAQEFAISLLLVESALDNFNEFSPEFTRQVKVISVRLRSAVQGKWDKSQMSMRQGPDGISSKAQEKELMAQLSHECCANLKQIEEVLDGFFRDSTKNYELPMLFPLFKQISGILVMLEYDRANALLVACRNLIEEFSRFDCEHKQSEQVRLAEGLSSIGFFIEALKYEQHDCINIIEAAINQFGSDVVAAAVPLPVPKFVPSAPDDRLAPLVPAVLSDLPTVQIETTTFQEASPGTQEALLGTFLEESAEVLASIETCIRACRNDASDRDSLTTMCRGFHTLKGSGRTVGLLKIAEVAWSMEQILSRWLRLSEGKPVTDELLDLIAKVHQEFCGWCASLKEQNAIRLSTDELQVSIEGLASGTESEAETEAETEAEAVDADLDAQTASATTVPET
ncbi:MAG: Hpt domain-containing protein, partial [Nitrosomonadaceae bacterium]|nr:Hpt domain-containing protein [Nitrosomonadaceae bacterium]